MFYVIDLVGFIASVLIAVRLHSYPAVFWELMGWSQRWAAFLGGLTIFVPLIVLTAWLGSRAAKAVYKPGIYTLNRVLGAAVAASLAITVALVGLLFLRAAPLPFGIGGFVKGSAIAEPAIEAAEPVIAALDDILGLDLCGGRLERIISEVCRSD